MAENKSPMAQMKSKLDMKNYIHSGKHWSELKFFDHMLTDALMKHIFGLVRYQMTDPSEIIETVGQMKSDSERDWAIAWGNTAKIVQSRADEFYKDKKMVSRKHVKCALDRCIDHDLQSHGVRCCRCFDHASSPCDCPGGVKRRSSRPFA